jgi:hypothetical protein
MITQNSNLSWSQNQSLLSWSRIQSSLLSWSWIQLLVSWSGLSFISLFSLDALAAGIFGCFIDLCNAPVLQMTNEFRDVTVITVFNTMGNWGSR